MGRGGASAVGDDRHGILRFDHLPDPFRVVGFVGEHEAVGRQLIVEQMPGKRAVVGLAGAQGEAERRLRAEHGFADGYTDTPGHACRLTAPAESRIVQLNCDAADGGPSTPSLAMRGGYAGFIGSIR